MCVSNFCQNDELSWLSTNRFSASRYMKVKIMGITEILRRIWLFSANKIKHSESISKQPTQLNSSLRHIIVTIVLNDHYIFYRVEPWERLFEKMPTLKVR